jgi:hypothetical protein
MLYSADDAAGYAQLGVKVRKDQIERSSSIGFCLLVYEHLIPICIALYIAYIITSTKYTTVYSSLRSNYTAGSMDRETM